MFGAKFHDYLLGPWEEVRGYLKEELEQLRQILEARWASAFNNDNTLNAHAVENPDAPVPSYVANTGHKKSPRWEKVDLANGVKNRLAYSNLTAATTDAVVLGRASGDGDGDWEEVPMSSIIGASSAGGGGGMGLDGEPGQDGFMGMPGPAGNAGANGVDGATGAQGPMGPPGITLDGNDGADGMLIQGIQGISGRDGSSVLLYTEGVPPAGNTINTSLAEVAFASTYTFPANNLLAGDVLRLTLAGVYGDTGTPTLTIKTKLGATTMANTGAITLPNTVTNQGWIMVVWFVVTAIGAGGTVEVQAYTSYQSAATTALNVHTPATAAVSLDTTASKALTVTVQFSASDILNTITCRQFILEKVASASSKTGVIGIVIDGGGSLITTGVKGFVHVPVNCTITAARIFSIDSAATAGSIVIDVWKDTYTNYPPTVADTITAAAKPTLSAVNKNQDTTLTGWTKAITAGDVLGFNVDSASTVTKVILELSVAITS